MGDVTVTQVTEPYTMEVDLASLDFDGVNTYRIVAVSEDGTILGGRMDPESGIFTLKTQETGSFTIAYVSELRRIQMHIGSTHIVDLAGNVTVPPMDVPPTIENGRTLLPVRFVAYAMEASVYWNYETYTVTLIHGGQVLQFAIGETAPGMDAPAQIINNRTMAPLRFVAEFFDAIVTWDEAEGRIEIIR